MKTFRLRTILMICVLLVVAAGLALAEDTIVEPNPLANFDYNRDRVQYSGQDTSWETIAIAAVRFDYNRDQMQYRGQAFSPPAPTDSATLPVAMETALVSCTAESTGPCDLIATSAEDIAGVWRQYLGNPRINAPGGVGYIRWNADGTFVWADSIENTAHPNEGYPAGTFSFDGAEFIIGPAVGTPPPCDIPPHYQLRVLKYGDQPVALSYVPIHDDCPPRSQDLIQAGIWVAE